ncbi:MAG: ribonuclease HII [Candidatus Tantalella remota]|nr:ribonuclease HII [Candidatus Tantalella remota]
MSRKANLHNATDTFRYERKAVASGFMKVAGIDEAGRGPLAGPVVASAVIVRDNDFAERIDDSKKLTERMRERAFFEILQKCDVGIGMASVEEIDDLNILNATLLAMKKAVAELEEEPDHLLIDGRMNVLVPQSRTYIIRGDSLSVSIACASIIAKVFRDRMMMEEDRKYPDYGFARHKGYGTQQHISAIREHGLCPIHRKTFGPFGSESRQKKKTDSFGSGRHAPGNRSFRG